MNDFTGEVLAKILRQTSVGKSAEKDGCKIKFDPEQGKVDISCCGSDSQKMAMLEEVKTQFGIDPKIQTKEEVILP